MRDRRAIAATLLAALALGATLGLSGAANAAAGIDKQDFSQVEKGRYLNIVGDCAACHTLPGSSHELAGGRPIETPFVTLLAPNITPDP
jgi:cytochrome c553